MEVNQTMLLDENGQPKVFYHGTNSEPFTQFDPRCIGSANDLGWYGKGFYFCYTEGEAKYYGRNIIGATLSIQNPFYFQEELETVEGQETSVIGDMAAFAINLSKKFPRLAKQCWITLVESFNEDGIADKQREIDFIEYADMVHKVFCNPEFQVFECWHDGKPFYRYRLGNDYNIIYLQFETCDQAEKNRLDAAATYISRKYPYVELHTPSYFMEQIASQFSEELQKRGYDGILQSAYGDEAVCFWPEQIHIVSQTAFY